MSEDKSTFTHLNDRGEANMVDVSAKAETQRHAAAQSFVQLNKETFTLLEAGGNKKGDVLATARIAGIQAAKKCSELIPLCHPLLLTKITVDIKLNKQHQRVEITAQCQVDAKTGVEMEALTAASIAALTIYDMCKAIDKGIVISNTQLLTKTGGKSGDWSRE